MAWAFTWSLWLTVAAGLLGLALLYLVIRARVPGRAGMAFALLLGLESVNFLTDGGAWLLHFTQPAWERGLASIAVWSSVLLAPAYLFFLRYGALTRATHWLTTRGGGIFAWTYAAVFLVFATATATGNAGAIPLPVIAVLLLSNIGVYLLAIVAALLAFTGAAKGTPARRRGAALLLAFGFRDIVWFVGAFGLANNVLLAATGNASGSEIALPQLYILYGIVGVVYFPAVVYAMLSGRIIDLDQRFKLGVTQTTAAAMVGGIFLIFTETVEASIDTSSAFFSVLVAIILAFLFRPIQMIAARMTTRLFPTAPGTAQDEREAFYAEQVRLAWEDGSVTPKERAMLKHVAKRLQIDAVVASRLEADARTVRPKRPRGRGTARRA